MGLILGLVLPDFDVGRTCRDLDHVGVALAVGKGAREDGKISDFQNLRSMLEAQCILYLEKMTVLKSKGVQ